MAEMIPNIERNIEDENVEKIYTMWILEEILKGEMES